MRIRAAIRSVMSVCLLLATTLAMAAEPEPIVVGERLEFRSEILDETRTLNIALPGGYEESDEAYPVLFVLDAGMNFPFTAAMLDYLSAYNTIPKLIIVGVENNSRATRNRDFTPTPYQGPAGRYEEAGGADRFLEFMTGELVPHIDGTYRTHPFRILIGHSLSGLFAGHALMHGSDVFGAFVAISPSLWWNEMEQMPLLEAFADSRDDLNAFAYMTLADEGDQEDVDRFRKLCETMDEKGGADFRCLFRRYPEYDHASTAIPATIDALQALYADWMLPWETITSGLPAVREHYVTLSRRFRYDVPLTEQALHNAACSAIVGGHLDEAIEMFAFNLQRSPDWTPTYAMLAEAWLEKGDQEKARDYAEQALEKDPESRKAREVLTRLESDD